MSKIMYKGISYANAGVSSDATSIPTADMTAAFDSTAHMNSTDMTSQEVSDFVDELDGQGANLADYVVEEGTVDNWTYRKWNSGWAEAWGVVSLASADFTQTGYVYYRQVTSNAYPSGVFKASGVKVAFANCQFGNIGSATVGIGSSDFSLSILSASSTARAVTVHVYLKGVWK